MTGMNIIPITSINVHVFLQNYMLHACMPSINVCVRAHLLQARLPFRVLYGDSVQALQNLSFAWSSHVRSQSALRPEILPRWEGVCESCSDPECEHRLFSRLLAQASPQ